MIPNYNYYHPPGLYRRLAYSEYIRQRLYNRNNSQNSLSNSSIYTIHTYNPQINPQINSTNLTSINSGIQYNSGVQFDAGLQFNRNEHRFYSNYDSSNSLLHNFIKKTTIKLHDKESIECSICLDPIKSNKHIVRYLECNHYFHVKCIDYWILHKPECPLCRKKI